MKEIINNMLSKAYDEKDFDLANIANDLLEKLAITSNAPSNWRSAAEELAKEWKDNEWIIESVFCLVFDMILHFKSAICNLAVRNSMIFFKFALIFLNVLLQSTNNEYKAEFVLTLMQ